MPYVIPDWLPDTLLDDDQRAVLRRFITPRRDLDGDLLWPIHELQAQQ
jgi:hypothetical protein